MKAWQLKDFGLNNLAFVDVEKPEPGPKDVLVRFEAASVNPRDYQIIMGQFTPNIDFPLIPVSDGAGTITTIGNDVTELRVGDRVTPLFFPNWHMGEALGDERKLSSGLEVPGVLREYGVYREETVVRIPDYLTASEAACLPCAGLTAWTSLVTIANIQPDNTVLIQGTGGVAIAGLQLSKALGARVVVISSRNEKLALAKELGADHCINYVKNPEWGIEAFEYAHHGVDAVLEIGGSGTMANSLTAIRHGGHIAVIGYMSGIDVGVTVFPLIIKCANLHGIATGNSENYRAMLAFMEKHEVKPQISAAYSYEEADKALGDIALGTHFGKIVIDLES